MAGEEEKGGDFYAVLGLKKECTASELRDAYKKLALRWHPDRCSASGNSKSVEESKKKFQAIQHAYSVLSDANKRFMYDVGVYESDDDETDMGEFFNEMAVMMSQTESNENGEESLEELQELFHEMLQGDNMESFASTSQTCFSNNTVYTTSSSTSSYVSYRAGSASSSKRNSMEMSRGNGESSSGFDCHFKDFCFGMEEGRGLKKRKLGTGGGTPEPIAGDKWIRAR
ncbi:uncharacterized protein LOC116201238 isoform X1 [Punica granatum]|uniref:Uncharacterized protein LOC116201238 isoform X1 n=1 Tax=Punica granatum TaxID=22663 RepID=A0A6P8CW05_PUNGR|nr:uncharacterized protein LOC116201238 isoform X1 [Punica granatum]